MCKENDRGCCFLLPSYVSFILLAMYDATLLFVSFSIVMLYHDKQDQTDYRTMLINLTIAVGVFITFFIYLPFSKDAWSRKLVFFSHVVSLIWMTTILII